MYAQQFLLRTGYRFISLSAVHDAEGFEDMRYSTSTAKSNSPGNPSLGAGDSLAVFGQFRGECLFQFGVILNVLVEAVESLGERAGLFAHLAIQCIYAL